MERVPMSTYEAARDAFRWEVPERFNFAVDVIDAIASARPDHPALIWSNDAGSGRTYTFDEMRRLSCRLANALRTAGIEKGDRLIVMLPRIPEWQVSLLGCLRIGAIPIPCVEMLTESDIAYRLRNSGARGAITTRVNVGKFAGAALDLRLSVGGGEWPDFHEATAAQPDGAEPAEVRAEDPAIMFYTSGSTGEPKGVLHAARAIFAWRVSAWYWLSLEADDVMWCTSDTGWSKAGTSILFGPWSCASTVVFHDGPFDAQKRLEILSRNKVSVFCAAATELRRLVLADFAGCDLSSLRLTVSAGEIVNPDLVTRWREKTGVPVLDAYGQTETLMTVLNYPQMPVKPGSMGKPLPGTDIAVIDEDRRLVPRGESGELVIKLPNPQVMLGYWKEPERTAAMEIAIEGERWLLTSDRVRIDEEGYVFHDGRTDDVINSAGYRIGPMEVENAVNSHPAVAESAAVASPDAERGEVVKAFVVLKPGVSASDALSTELQNHCKRATGPYKYPRRIEFVDDLPKTVSGKIRRRELRDREAGTSGGS